MDGRCKPHRIGGKHPSQLKSRLKGAESQERPQINPLPCCWEVSACHAPRIAMPDTLLGSNIYRDQSYSNFIALPLLEGCTFGLAIVAFIAFTTRAELWREWKRLWREVIAEDSFRDDWRDVSPIRHGISRSIAPREWLGKVRSKLVDWTSRSVGKPALEKVAIPPALRSQSLSSPANIQPADSRTELSSELPSQAEPKSPVQGQSIFPGARRGSGASQEPVAWDESQWID